jgi:putative restriction endonuclease
VYDLFWTLTKSGIPVLPKVLGNSPTIKQMTIEVDGAVLADDLWQLLRDRTALHALRAHLLQHHFGRKSSDVQAQMPVNPIDYEVDKLKAEAQSRFRILKVSEPSDSAGYYVRHALFPRVIKEIYHDACAVCALSTRMEGGSRLIDAAHIKPFAVFHNDDPRNGIALCKNHHWGFDAGWFSFSDAYRILVSPKLRDSQLYVTAGDPLRLPDNPQHHPAPDALVWHRQKFNLG